MKVGIKKQKGGKSERKKKGTNWCVLMLYRLKQQS